ncbi:hypothetical protein [Aliarcobacter butzleri]|uniref:hypothetical protein n=1 Tax=Aliarcobacter butzleri TaxID=28197 RepID=UPI00126A3DC8|nr:hypothetical protein [Aliarcobacter butzleri]
MLLGERVPRGKCKIGDEIMFFDFWNSKEKTNQDDNAFEYLGYGRVIYSRGFSVEKEDSKSWSGHFWRSKKIPKEQDYKFM